MKIALGTVQFGLDYGVANTRGRIPRDEAATILAEARAFGCDTLDTAMAYGDAERRLGDMRIEGWRVVTKLPALPEHEDDVVGWARKSVEGALARLRIESLYGLLLHRPEQLLGPRGGLLADALRSVRDAGLVQKVGVSVNAPPDIDAFASRCDLNLVQAPFNLLDRRLTEHGRLERLVAAGTEVHARSVFLQGLLLMDEDRRPPAFDRWAAVWRTLSEWLREQALTPLEACLRDALAQAGLSRVVVGVDSLAHWRGIAAACRGPAPRWPAAFAAVDAEVINPLAWLTYPPDAMKVRG